MEAIRGKVWKFGENISTIDITPSEMFQGSDRPDNIVFAGIRPDWKNRAKKGDIIVAARNWGCGSHREEAITILKKMGISAIVADSIARIYYRNCISVALPALICPGVSEIFNENDEMELDYENGIVTNLTTGKTIQSKPLPKTMMDIFQAGGIIPVLMEKLGLPCRRE